MAVNSITFGGVNSADFGIYVSGEGVFNAPKRDVEMIKIPGRNGAFALDNGRFENIEVTYPAFNFEPDDYDTFMQNLSDFRNAICAQRGYQRLTDTFHPDEYRMATYIGGLEIKPVKYNTASEFNIVFDCKPQRWLTSGETAVMVTSGDTLTNPTLFESGPLLEATGSGAIQFNGYEIDFAGIPYGEVQLCRADFRYDIPVSDPYRFAFSYDIDNLLNSGDVIYPDYRHESDPYADFGIQAMVVANDETSGDYNIESAEIISSSNTLDAYATVFNGFSGQRVNIFISPNLGAGFVYGTTKTITSSAVCKYRYRGTDYTETVQVTITYDGARLITVSMSMSGTVPSGFAPYPWRARSPYMYGDSTVPIQGVPIYIDCDLGEAYYIKDGEYVSLNQQIDLGSELPKLGVGENEITFDNTITELKVTPRWWKV